MSTAVTPGPRITPDGVALRGDLQSAANIALDADAVVPIARFLKDGVVSWPGGLAPRLADVGRTLVSVVDRSGRIMASVEHDFGGARRWRRPTDPWGRRLSLDKWGWWTVQLADRDAAELDRAVADMGSVLHELSALGLPAWIAGGTLLGAVRDEGFIPHDDDVDIAYLASSSIPDEVARESFALERHFVSAGWGSRRYSGAHFQLRGEDVGGAPPIHVDVFCAFFREGQLNQPFHVRGPLRRRDLLPLGEVTLSGTRLPAPRDVRQWLELNYGPHWSSPDPNHVLGTPRQVERLFGGWFGHYQGQHEYWEDVRARTSSRRVPSASARWLANVLAPGTTVVELGCGDGTDARFLADRGFPVLATDFAAPAGPLELPPSGLAYARANVSDPRDLLRLAIRARSSGRRVHVHSRHLVDRLDPASRRMMLAALRHFPGEASLSMTGTLAPHDHLDPSDPATGRVSWRSIRRDSLASCIDWRPMLTESASDAGGTLLWGERTGMGYGTGLKRLRDLPRTLREVRVEIGELRRVPLRLAEIQDLVVAELSEIEVRGTKSVREADTEGAGSWQDVKGSRRR